MSHSLPVLRGMIVTVLCACVLFTATDVHAVPVSQLARDAQISASKGDWNTSARSLEQLVEAGIDSSEILYNLGTAYANAGRFGEAVWRFEQVSHRSLFASQARHNLRVTRVLLARRDVTRLDKTIRETAVPMRISVAELMPRMHAVLFTVGLQFVAFIALFFRLRRPSNEAVRVGLSLGAVLTGLASVFTFVVLIMQLTMAPGAVVLRDGLSLLRGPAADAIEETHVREGVRVEILGSDGPFVRVRTLEGDAGWLRARDVGKIVDG